MEHPSCRPVVADATAGSTIRNTAAGPRIATKRLQTDSEVLHAATRSLIAKTRLGNKSVVRAAIWLATEMEGEQATEAEQV